MKKVNILPNVQRRRILSEKKEKGVSADTVLKNYWSGNEEFADLFNAVLFGGSQIIRADELENEDTEDSVVLEQRKQAGGGGKGCQGQCQDHEKRQTV